MSVEPACFWMVYGAGCGAPTVRHDRLGNARAEAERLAVANPGTKFYVLRSVGVARRVDVDWAEIEEDEIPF